MQREAAKIAAFLIGGIQFEYIYRDFQIDGSRTLGSHVGRCGGGVWDIGQSYLGRVEQYDRSSRCDDGH